MHVFNAIFLEKKEKTITKDVFVNFFHKILAKRLDFILCFR